MGTANHTSSSRVQIELSDKLRLEQLAANGNEIFRALSTFLFREGSKTPKSFSPGAGLEAVRNVQSIARAGMIFLHAPRGHLLPSHLQSQRGGFRADPSDPAR
jgi:hypothetical protein